MSSGIGRRRQQRRQPVCGHRRGAGGLHAWSWSHSGIDPRVMPAWGHAAWVQLPGLPVPWPAAGAGQDVWVRPGGVQPRAARQAGSPPSQAAVPEIRGPLPATHHPGEENPGMSLAGRRWSTPRWESCSRLCRVWSRRIGTSSIPCLASARAARFPRRGFGPARTTGSQPATPGQTDGRSQWEASCACPRSRGVEVCWWPGLLSEASSVTIIRDASGWYSLPWSCRPATNRCLRHHRMWVSIWA